MSKKKVENRKNYITAKLVFYDWGWADNIIFRIKGKVSEKNKGLEMINKIKEFFGIRNNDIEEHESEVRDEEVERINWTRDERGNIISPFRSKKIR
ncbi:hypothetical protein LCGC14_1824460 [marine sediment metagenome]|uniref:Uncharacterized protein n=1 Tax=marine sediment metagenome TaxID=412755 RepID=A0A0F9CKX0_9ZZZZ